MVATASTLWAVVYVCILHIAVLSRGFELTLLHTNDVHARFVQFNKYGTPCGDDDAADGKCFGGVARRMTKVREIRTSHDNVLLLDAGDQFLGTLWFTYYKGMAASNFMTEIGYDVMCLGNHEFDLGVDGLATFLDNITFPVVSVNTDVAEEPRLQGKFTSSHVFTVGGEKIGVIGYVTTETAYISNAGSTIHFDEVLTSVEAEVTTLSNDGVNKIIALGHAGYAMDQQVARLADVDVVIGGHTNTFLYTGDAPSGETAQGEYPTVVTKQSGSKALVLQAVTWGKYLGYLNVTFDSAGEVTAYSGNPILLDSAVQQDPSILQEVQQWSIPIQEFRTEEAGYSKVTLNGDRQSCRLNECTMGTVTVGDVMAVLPFGNEVDLIDIKGSNLREQLELAVRDWNPDDANGRFLQFSGLKVEYNLLRPAGERVISVQVRCLQCDIPSYSPLIDGDVYSIFLSSFIVQGGHGYSFDPIKRERFNSLDSDVLSAYFRKHSPVYAELQGRIKYSTGDTDTSSAVSTASSIVIIVAMTLITWIY